MPCVAAAPWWGDDRRTAHPDHPGVRDWRICRRHRSAAAVLRPCPATRAWPTWSCRIWRPIARASSQPSSAAARICRGASRGWSASKPWPRAGPYSRVTPAKSTRGTWTTRWSCTPPIGPRQRGPCSTWRPSRDPAAAAGAGLGDCLAVQLEARPRAVAGSGQRPRSQPARQSVRELGNGPWMTRLEATPRT
jgi:hypothetical protein